MRGLNCRQVVSFYRNGCTKRIRLDLCNERVEFQPDFLFLLGRYGRATNRFNVACACDAVIRVLLCSTPVKTSWLLKVNVLIGCDTPGSQFR